MTEFVNTIDLLGDDVVAGSLVDRSITEYNDNGLTNIGKYAFSECRALTSVNLPNVTIIDYAAFGECRALTSVNLPNVTSMGSFALSGCTALKTIRLPKLISIQNNAFVRSNALKTLILDSPTVCYLYSKDSAGGIANGGTVYVPQALIESYQTATNWSALYAAGTCNFVAIEGSEYE
jgi:hypothetical protein